MINKPGFLAVGNFDSDIGYAWRLMEYFWVALAQTLRPKGWVAHICFPSISRVPECLLAEDFHVHQVDFTKWGLSDVVAQAKFLRRHNIKFIYFTDLKSVDWRYLIYRLAGVQLILVHDHSPGVKPVPSKFNLFIKKCLHRVDLISVNACFAVSPYIHSRMLRVNGLPLSKVFCVTNGIVPDREKPILRQASNIKIVSVARANYYKGIDFALSVVALIVADLGADSVSYTLYGDGPNLEDFQQLADQLEIKDNVYFAGKVADIPSKLKDFDIAFHPSRGEAMSLAILEYMRAGLPVVVPSNPSVSSFLQHNKTALIYSEGEVNSAAKSIMELMHSYEKRQKLGLAGWAAVLDTFNEDNMRSQFCSSLHKVLRLKPRLFFGHSHSNESN